MTGIIDYGMGNLRSVQKALEYLGERAIVLGEPSMLDACDRLILPGVGSFGVGMRELKTRGLYDYVLRRAKNTPLLGICLGMQFLLAKSYEDGETEGFGFVPGDVVRFREGKIPQIGWNQVHHLKSPLFAGIPEGSEFYFVHSYHAETTDRFTIASCDYGVTYAAAVANGNVYGTQFHPEKSGVLGLKLLQNFVRLEAVL